MQGHDILVRRRQPFELVQLLAAVAGKNERVSRSCEWSGVVPTVVFFFKWVNYMANRAALTKRLQNLWKIVFLYVKPRALLMFVKSRTKEI